MIKNKKLQRFLIDYMVDIGYFRRIGSEFLEDNGGHLMHESQIGREYFNDFLEGLSGVEYGELATEWEAYSGEQLAKILPIKKERLKNATIKS